MLRSSVRTFVFVLISVAAFVAVAAKAQENQSLTAQQTAQQTLRAGVYVSEPFVMRDGDSYSGMAIDLWNMLAGNLGATTEYTEYPTFRDLVRATAAGEIDIALTNLTITKQRAQIIDFTHPWFDAGLRLMVNEDQGAGFWQVMGGLRASGHLRAYAWIIGIILTATLVLTIFDRRFDMSFPKRWRDGIAESFYTVMSVATSGRPPTRKNLFGWAGRMWQGVWLVCGVAVLAYVTSSVTSVMTTLSLTNQISNVEDVDEQPIGVLSGSVAEEFARRNSMNLRSYANVDNAANALRNGSIQAVIADAPVLEYYAYSHPALPLDVVGPIFEPDKYGFGLPLLSPLTRQLSVELIGAHESGAIEAIRARYFGDEL